MATATDGAFGDLDKVRKQLKIARIQLGRVSRDAPAAGIAQTQTKVTDLERRRDELYQQLGRRSAKKKLQDAQTDHLEGAALVRRALTMMQAGLSRMEGAHSDAQAVGASLLADDVQAATASVDHSADDELEEANEVCGDGAVDPAPEESPPDWSFVRLSDTDEDCGDGAVDPAPEEPAPLQPPSLKIMPPAPEQRRKKRARANTEAERSVKRRATPSTEPRRVVLRPRAECAAAQPAVGNPASRSGTAASKRDSDTIETLNKQLHRTQRNSRVNPKDRKRHTPRQTSGKEDLNDFRWYRERTTVQR
jgi:hypothetical protein